MRYVVLMLLICTATEAKAVLVGDGIVDSVTVTRNDIGGGFDELIISVDVGSDSFFAFDGGFVPLDLSSPFNQNNFLGLADATPPQAFFIGGFVEPDDTTFLITRDKGDPDADGANVDTTLELSSLSIGYATPITGSFDLARLVVPNGAGALTIGDSVPGALAFAGGSAGFVGSISGTIAAVPEASVVVAWSLAPVLCGVQIFRRNRLRRVTRTVQS